MENDENCVYWELDKYQVSLLLKHVSQFKTENEVVLRQEKGLIKQINFKF